MATLTITTCDFCKEESPIHRKKTVDVVFFTEQTEGRGSGPYLDKATFDFCDKCFTRFLLEHPISATGAQGYNKYTLVEPTE